MKHISESHINVPCDRKVILESLIHYVVFNVSAIISTWNFCDSTWACPGTGGHLFKRAQTQPSHLILYGFKLRNLSPHPLFSNSLILGDGIAWQSYWIFLQSSYFPVSFKNNYSEPPAPLTAVNKGCLCELTRPEHGDFCLVIPKLEAALLQFAS